MSLHDFYMMPWNEFAIKSFAYRRMERSKWEHTRFIAFHALVGPHVDHKSLPKNLESFLSLNGGQKEKRVSKATREQYYREMQEYLSKVNK